MALIVAHEAARVDHIEDAQHVVGRIHSWLPAGWTRSRSLLLVAVVAVVSVVVVA